MTSTALLIAGLVCCDGLALKIVSVNETTRSPNIQGLEGLILSQWLTPRPDFRGFCVEAPAHETVRDFGSGVLLMRWAGGLLASVFKFSLVSLVP